MFERPRGRRPQLRNVALALAYCLTAIAAWGCHGSGLQQSALPQPAVLIVRNQGYFDVNVYVVPSSGGSAIRLATVNGNSTATLKIPPTELQMGYVLVVRLHAIGSRYWWDSPSVTLDPSTIARLDIASDPDGNLSRSSFYTSSVDLSGDTAQAFLR
jgi:hypothetical protein